jgi:hypothetical protein
VVHELRIGGCQDIATLTDEGRLYVLESNAGQFCAPARPLSDETSLPAAGCRPTVILTPKSLTGHRIFASRPPHAVDYNHMLRSLV